MSASTSRHRPLIALDALLVNRTPTGVGRSILELVKAMSSRTREWDFLLLASEPDLFTHLEGIPGWRVQVCPDAAGNTLRKALFTQFQLPRICRQEKVALLHSLQFVSPLIMPCPCVVTVHDLAWRRFPGTVEQPRLGYYRVVVPPSLNRAAAIVTNSQATATDTAALYPATAEKINPTFFGTPSWVWNQARNMMAPEERPFFLFVGTLEPRKNLENLLEAYEIFRTLPQVAAMDPNTVPSLLFIGGKGWRDSKIQEMMARLRAQSDLEILDYCNTARLGQSYQRAHALLFPSLHEGFGFPILEAMAFGLPVLTSDRGAMAEVAGQNALLVNPEDIADLANGMARIAFDVPLRDRLSQAGPDWARQWSWERTADLTAGVYRRVLQESVR